MIIETQNISKSFKGRLVLDHISFRIGKSEIFCILGKNGAGKSTLLNIVANLVKPDGGAVLYDDEKIGRMGIPKQKEIGYLGQFDLLLNELNTYDYLTFIGKIFRLPEDYIKTQSDFLIDYFFSEKQQLSEAIGGYSTGMRKKVALCACLIHKPDLLILDEPFTNLDPQAADSLSRLLEMYSGKGEMYSGKGRTILMASHDLFYVKQLATQVGLLRDGSLSMMADFDYLKSSPDFVRTISSRLSADPGNSGQLLHNLIS